MREEIFIIFDEENIKNRLRNRIEQLTDTSDNTEGQIVINVRYDWTKVPKALALSEGTKAILVGVALQHIISVEDKSEDEVRALLDLKSSIVCVDKIKAAVISIQTPGKSREKLHSSVLSSCCS